MKIVQLMVAVQCSGFAGSIPKADQDIGRDKCGQSRGPAELWRRNRRWPGEEVRKRAFRQREQHRQRESL